MKPLPDPPPRSVLRAHTAATVAGRPLHERPRAEQQQEAAVTEGRHGASGTGLRGGAAVLRVWCPRAHTALPGRPRAPPVEGTLRVWFSEWRGRQPQEDLGFCSVRQASGALGRDVCGQRPPPPRPPSLLRPHLPSYNQQAGAPRGPQALPRHPALAWGPQTQHGWERLSCQVGRPGPLCAVLESPFTPSTRRRRPLTRWWQD